MKEPLNDEIDVIETETENQGVEYGPEIGNPDYWLDETSEYDGDETGSVFGLEEGSYEMKAIELDRNIRELGQRAHWTPSDDGAVFFAEGEFMYLGIEDIDYDEGIAEVHVEKGNYQEFSANLSEMEETDEEVSEGFFDRVVGKVEVNDEELERQRSRNV